jgi:quercetin dioxygenase-like cupin family protein
VEPEGGDSACWAHLFGEQWAGEDHEHAGAEIGEKTGSCIAPGVVVDLPAMVRAASGQGAAWTQRSEDLQVNLVVFPTGEGVAEHVNTEVDVLLVGIAGTGAVTIDGTRRILRAGLALVIPKGTNRSIESLSDPFAYLTCHRHRDGLWPGSRS